MNHKRNRNKNWHFYDSTRFSKMCNSPGVDVVPPPEPTVVSLPDPGVVVSEPDPEPEPYERVKKNVKNVNGLKVTSSY